MKTQQDIHGSLNQTRLILSLGLIGFLASILFSHAAPPAGYRLQWADEFLDNSLNLNYWNYAHNGWRNQAYNTPDAISVANGCMVNTTYTQNGTNFTGFINTFGKVYLGYGYYEARIQFSNAPAQWSAFWLQSDYNIRPQPNGCIGNNNNNPTNGVEMDIFEHRAVDGNGTDYSNGGDFANHWNGYCADEKSDAWFSTSLGVRSGFHTYGLLWTPTSYTFYVDGVAKWTPSGDMISSAPEFIQLTSEVQDHSWAGSIPPGGYPSKASSQLKMYVDYVRYYTPVVMGIDDFDHDNCSDAVYVTTNANPMVWHTRYSSTSADHTFTWGSPGDIPFLAQDLDADSVVDAVVYRPSNQKFYYHYSAGGSTSFAWGNAGDVPLMGGDFDGDGCPDPVCINTNLNPMVWNVRYSSTGASHTFTWGSPGDIPFVADDLDRDGLADAVVYRPSNHTFYYHYSRGGSTSFAWGNAGDIPLMSSSSMDGNGVANAITINPSTMVWNVRYSHDGSSHTFQWGNPGDIPFAKGDYDQDGITDAVVYRPSNFTWYKRKSTGGSGSYVFGNASSVPVH